MYMGSVSIDSIAGSGRKIVRPALMVLLAIVLSISISFPSVSADSETDESEHEYHNDEWTFLIISFVMTYAIASVIAGLFTLKFGQGKSRILAAAMLSSGLVIWGIWIYFKLIVSASYPDDTILGIIYWSTAPLLKPILAVVGFIFGGGIALFMFLTFVVRS